MIGKNKTLLLCFVCGALITYTVFNVDVNGNYFITKKAIAHGKVESEDVIKPCSDHIRILTVQPQGNLGNLIWEYMSLFVIYKMYAKDNFLPYIEKSMKQKLELVFERLSLPTSYFVNGASPVKVLRRDTVITEETFRDNCSSILLQEYSARYEDIIKFNVDNIRKELRFKKKLVEEIMDTMSNAQRQFYSDKDNVTFVGIHYRGTDYVHHLVLYHGKLFKGPPDYRYYVQGMDYFKAKYDNVIFFLISIDYSWLKVNEPYITNNSKVVVNPYHDDPIKDLVLLSHCNHTIINYGTYGATAAFFNKGTTLVYDLQLPLDHRGQTIAMSISKILSNWFILSCNNNNNSVT